MAISEIFIGFAISYFAGNTPAIKDLLGNRKTLAERIENSYKAVIKKMYGIDHWHMDMIPYRFRSLQSFGNHLASVDDYEDETLKILELFENELKNDHECYQYIIDLRIDSMAADIEEIKQSVKAKNKSFKEVSAALKSVNRVSGSQHVERSQTNQLYKWICSDLSKLKHSRRIAALLGDPGTGKTVILADLVDKLEAADIPVIGLKADLLFDSTETDIDRAVNFGTKTLLGALNESAETGITTVLVVDQMDALSLSLTTQRKPLAEVRKVIYEASQNSNIRVVFSCRKYDWENDLQLTEYDGAYIERVDRLDLSELEQILKNEGLDIHSLPRKTIEIIQTPIYLSLFLRVWKDVQTQGISTIAELQRLYWDKIILTESQRQGYKHNDLVELLGLLSDKMIASQSLVVSIAAIPTQKHNDLHFLVSNGFLTIDASKTKVQFSHQTLFDYTFSRLFCERNSSLICVLKDRHQGLFIRNTIRRVLEYQRPTLENQYVENIKIILGINDCGVAFRFHLKQLVLTILGAQDTILPQEVEMLKKHIFTRADYLRTFTRVVYAEGSVNVLLDYVKEQGGLSKCEEIVSDRVIQLIPNFVFSRNFAFARRIISQCAVDFYTFSDHSRGVLESCIRQLGINENAVADIELAFFILETLKSLDKIKERYPYSFVYRSLVKYYPQEVAARLHEYVQAVLKLWNKADSYSLSIDRDTDYVVDALKEKKPKIFWNVGLKILDNILERSEIESEKADIKTSSLFFFYNRSNSYHNFPESILDAVLQVTEKAVSEKWDNVAEVLSAKSESVFVMNHVVAITGWLMDIDTYHETAADYLIANINKAFHSSSLSYYQVRLFGNVFPYCSDEQLREHSF